jgi:hypothetical protein
MTYDDYKPTSTLRNTKDGKEVVRTTYVRAEDEIEAQLASGCPQRGDPLEVGTGSATSEMLYCEDVNISQIEEAAGDSDGLFLFMVTATFRPLSINNPTPNKAKWRVSFRPQQYNLKNVKDTAHQAHYGPDGSAAPQDYPEVKTAINVTEDGPQGVDVDEMVEVLTIDFWKYSTEVADFLTAIRAIGNTVNDAAFEGPWGEYAIGEARLTGVEVNKTSGEIATVTVEISRSKNDASVAVYLDSTDGTVSVTKMGWEYLWVRFLKGNKKDDDDVRPLSIDAHVATIYELGDFSVLGIDPGIWY